MILKDNNSKFKIMKIDQTNYKQTEEYQATLKIIRDLSETHAYDPDFKKGLDIMTRAMDDRISAFFLVADFFKQPNLDLFGEKTQKDRIAFFKLCKKLDDGFLERSLERRIEDDINFYHTIKLERERQQRQENENEKSRDRDKEEKKQRDNQSREAHDAFHRTQSGKASPSAEDIARKFRRDQSRDRDRGWSR